MPTHHFSHSLNRVVLLTLTGLCTVLTGSINAASIAKPTLIAQEVSSQQGKIFDGRLSWYSPRRWDNRYYKDHRFRGAVGQTLACLLSSQDFDTYLFLYKNGTMLASNDDYPLESTNSYFEVRLPETDTYTLRVSSFAARETGTYRIRCRISPNPYL